MCLRVLITDDDNCLVTLYQQLFAGQPDLHIDYAQSPAACRACLDDSAAVPYDLVLLDISLNDPQEDGFGLLREVRHRSPKTDVLMMSTMDNEATVERCMRLGAKTFTSKNIDFPKTLKQQVNSLLEKTPKAKRRRLSAAHRRQCGSLN